MPSAFFYMSMIPIFTIFSAILSVKTALYLDGESVRTKVAALGDDGGWVFLSLALAQLTVTAVAMFTIDTREAAGVDRPDQFAFETEKGVPVRMVREGAGGTFNRAQRALFNTQETLPVFLAHLLLASTLAPRMVFFFTVITAIGRIWFAAGYSASVAGRQAGFAVATVFGQNSLLGFVMLIGVGTTIAPGILTTVGL
jgi:uncharacterized membrane protein YecN with MAPEG domain